MPFRSYPELERDNRLWTFLIMSLPVIFTIIFYLLLTY